MDVTLPSLGEGADSGIVVSLLVAEGDTVEKGQTILELENEKAVAPIPSTAAGRVSKIHVKAGDKISIGARLLTIGESAPVAAAAPTPVAPASPAPLPPPVTGAQPGAGAAGAVPNV